MDTRTGEVFRFNSEEDLKRAKSKNPYLMPIECNRECNWLKEIDGKFFCKAGRHVRRRNGCMRKFSGDSKEVKL